MYELTRFGVTISLFVPINFYEVTKAAGHVRGSNTSFVCTKKGVASPLLSGDPLLVLGCGVTMAAIKAACGREALCVGKPSQDLAQLLVERYVRRASCLAPGSSLAS